MFVSPYLEASSYNQLLSLIKVDTSPLMHLQWLFKKISRINFVLFSELSLHFYQSL